MYLALKCVLVGSTHQVCVLERNISESTTGSPQSQVSLNWHAESPAETSLGFIRPWQHAF